MKKGIWITISILTLVLALLICSCTPQSAPSSPQTPPPYNTAEFIVSRDEGHAIPVYLYNNQTLHLTWQVEGEQAQVWFHIVTPNDVSFGFYEDDGHYANGTLEKGFCKGMTAGMTQFSPSEYGWGEGYYRMAVTTNADIDVTVRAEWWVEG